MYNFDERLIALTDCAVLEGEGGGMIFDPFPVATAESDQVLAHELCHVLAGRRDYKLFQTACLARKDNLFKYTLNLLYDWYHEYKYGKYSGVLWQKLTELHQEFPPIYVGVPELDELWDLYHARTISPTEAFPHLKDTVDLIAIADKLSIAAKEKFLALGWDINLPGIYERKSDKEGKNTNTNAKKGAGPRDIGRIPKRSNYYAQVVSRYKPIIEMLSGLWKPNKHIWKHNYYGEIDWRNLPGAFVGEKLNLPCWKTLNKIKVEREVYLVIDRSGSTADIKEVIMDTAVIIAESLRRRGTPISVLDVGVSDNTVNKIDESLDLSWFTPMSGGGTPLGQVCRGIKTTNPDSYLLVITDGLPNDWDNLVAALDAFPGSNLTFIIDQSGHTYNQYLSKVRNAIRVEPHTIIRELLNDQYLR